MDSRKSSDASPRLADVLGALSLATDLAAGVPLETSLKTCVVALTLGRALSLPDESLSNAYYTALLRHLGCTASSHEAANLAAGDDHDFFQTFESVEATDLKATGLRTIRGLARRAPRGERLRSVARVLAQPGVAAETAAAQCAQATALAAQIGMSSAVIRALGQIYERFDGRGFSAAVRGEAIELSARLLHVATTIEIQHRHGGRVRALDDVRRRRGTHLDPQIAAVFLSDPAPFWLLLESSSNWDVYLQTEPNQQRRLDRTQREPLALAFAQFADLKTPSKLGHSPAVASLAVKAARVAGLAPDQVADLRIAALLHDIGVVSVPNGIWEKPGALSVAEWERVRLHAYYTQRVLSRVPTLAAVTELASLHHERCDGSGYPRGVIPPASRRAARLLAASDVFCALVESRAYRPAFSKAAAADQLRNEVHAGRLCASSVNCVLAAVGQGQAPEQDPATKITAREAEVLVALARGLTNKEIGVALNISAKTVQHHLASIYVKVGVTTRAAAALFAVRHGLVPEF